MNWFIYGVEELDQLRYRSLPCYYLPPALKRVVGYCLLEYGYCRSCSSSMATSKLQLPHPLQTTGLRY